MSGKPLILRETGAGSRDYPKGWHRTCLLEGSATTTASNGGASSGTGYDSCPSFFVRPIGALLLPPRKTDLERGAPARLAGDRHVSAILPRDPIDRGEAQPAGAPGLGGEERVEDAVADLRRNARAAVRDGDPHIVPGPRRRVLAHGLGAEPAVGGLQGDGPPFRAG